ncbi:hypothetical protein ATANTOWER_020576, partial [Ataeniobius toweri]|nr:hypothetical protein [Ataeniobius toweri]
CLFSSNRLSVVNPFHKECLSCSLFKPNCSFYDAVLSPDHQHVLLNCREISPPACLLLSARTKLLSQIEVGSSPSHCSSQ